MSATKVLGVSLICLVLYIAAVDAECGSLSKVKLGACVTAFSTANLGNRDQRKERIDAGNTTCPTDIFKDSCKSYGVMKGCADFGGYPEGCGADYDRMLKEQNIECTHVELYNLCGGATALVTSFTLLITCIITIFSL
ncbi:uncharacterized protein LOC124149837 [Haliotis rufescens]|uniref:uncharacterized protein LOC124149837 n=1 Tax=Haliotis rufescens TaxID=6454 RepID=UPI001EAF9ABB|nr:uncharacterized protein LOC124149837 [Haliotis rufescens]